SVPACFQIYMCCHRFICCFFFTATATTEIYTLSLHDALPICESYGAGERRGKDLLLGIVATLYSMWLVYAAGLEYLLMVSVLYRSEEHTSELQSRENLVCRLLLEKKKKK